MTSMNSTVDTSSTARAKAPTSSSSATVITAAMTSWTSRSSRLVHCRNPSRDAIVRHVADDDRICTDNHIIPHLDGTEDLGPRADIHIVADHGRGRLINPPQADYDAVADTAIVAELCIAADHDAAEVIDDEVPTDLNLARQLDPGDDLNELECYLVDEREELAKEGGSDAVTPAAETIHDQRPEALGAPTATVV